MNRRSFLGFVSLLLGSLLVLPGSMCNKAGDLLQSLRGILNQVEKALAALSLLSGLLPDAINTAAKYLLAVCEFVDKVGRLLEDESQMAADKARQILSWASTLVMPVIPPPIGPLLAAVSAAVDHFLSYFGTTVANARSAQVSTPPELRFNDRQRAELGAIERDAVRDRQAVEEWQKRAQATPHSKLRYQTPRVVQFNV